LSDPVFPICTEKNPAPGGGWQWDWNHPDATGVEINEVYGDMRYTCPHCHQSYVSEGADA